MKKKIKFCFFTLTNKLLFFEIVLNFNKDLKINKNIILKNFIDFLFILLIEFDLKSVWLVIWLNIWLFDKKRTVFFIEKKNFKFFDFWLIVKKINLVDKSRLFWKKIIFCKNIKKYCNKCILWLLFKIKKPLFINCLVNFFFEIIIKKDDCRNFIFWVSRRIWTHNFQNHNLTLYQLNYTYLLKN